MRFLLCFPTAPHRDQGYSLWLVLHGAFSTAEAMTILFGQEATAHNALILAPQATRPCGAGYCWSFASDAAAIDQMIAHIRTSYTIDPTRIVLIGHSMGCTMGCWLVAQHSGLFAFFAAFGMGSAFEAWEHDDGGIDQVGLRASATTTRIFLAVDQADPSGCNAYFDHNLSRLHAAGLDVTPFRPQEGTHAVTAAMKKAMLEALTVTSMSTT